MAGGRDFNDYQLLSYVLDNLPYENYEIVSGAARGADTLGERYAARHRIPVKLFPVTPREWREIGPSAGYRRNEKMAQYGTHCVCFWDGKSKGTGHMIDLARKYGLPTQVVRYDQKWDSPVPTINKDILKVSKGIIAHQVNCMGIMGAGLAKKLADKFGDLERAYAQALRSEDLQLGGCLLIQVKEGLYVANLAGQFRYGRNRQHTDYKAVASALASLAEQAKKLNLPIYIPYKMGCGYGGGDWAVVLELIERHCPDAVICQL